MYFLFTVSDPIELMSHFLFPFLFISFISSFILFIPLYSLSFIYSLRCMSIGLCSGRHTFSMLRCPFYFASLSFTLFHFFYLSALLSCILYSTVDSPSVSLLPFISAVLSFLSFFPLFCSSLFSSSFCFSFVVVLLLFFPFRSPSSLLSFHLLNLFVCVKCVFLHLSMMRQQENWNAIASNCKRSAKCVRVSRALFTLTGIPWVYSFTSYYFFLTYQLCCVKLAQSFLMMNHSSTVARLQLSTASHSTYIKQHTIQSN